MSKKAVLSIDLGGSSTKIAWVNTHAEIIHHQTLMTSDYFHYSQWLQKINSLKQTLPEVEIIGIGIGAPNGNSLTGCIENPANLPWKGSTPIRQDLADAFRCPVALVNDANAAAIGEKVYGCAAPYRDFVYLTLGTGLGSCIFINNQLVLGKHAQAGELGHMIIHPNGRICGCGRRGCTEKYISATAVQLNYTELTQQTISVIEIAQKAVNGEPEAILSFNQLANELALFLSNIQMFTDTELIILSGGLLASDSLFLPQAIQQYQALNPSFQRPIEIKRSILPEQNAALLGAASLILETHTWDSEKN